jgi:hypothetical protein
VNCVAALPGKELTTVYYTAAALLESVQVDGLSGLQTTCSQPSAASESTPASGPELRTVAKLPRAIGHHEVHISGTFPGMRVFREILIMRPVYLSITLLIACFGASCDELEQRGWCTDICEKLQECADNELGVNTCSDRCDDAIDDDILKEADVKDCAICVDDHICRDVPDDCSICEDVLPEFTSRRFD